jgi:hypothetical protein
MNRLTNGLRVPQEKGYQSLWFCKALTESKKTFANLLKEQQGLAAHAPANVRMPAAIHDMHNSNSISDSSLLTSSMAAKAKARVSSVKTACH